MLTETEKLNMLGRLGVELNQVCDLDILMERVLSDARRFVNADAGSIYIRDGQQLHFSYSQNDTLQRRMPEGEKLLYSTFSIPVDTTSIAGYVAVTGRPLNIVDVYDLDPTEPYGFSKIFDQSTGYRTRSLFTVPLTTARGDNLGILQIINALDETGKAVAFPKQDEQMLIHFASIAAIALDRAQMTRTLLLRMIRMSELRDPAETADHVNRVGAYSVELYEQWAKRRGLETKEIERARDSLRMAAMLHDVGKVAISDLILKKPGRFNHDEYEIMKAHTILGARLFLDCRSDFDEAAREVALNHHERWDGKGYPGFVDIRTCEPLPERMLPDGTAQGKKGEEIPLFGRIVALADVYDALSSARIYKEAWKESDVLDAIAREAGAQFDPELVEIFFGCLNNLRAIQMRLSPGH